MRYILIFIFLFNYTYNYGQELLFYHIMLNNYEEVKAYEGDVNIQNNEDDPTPLMYAIYKADLKMVKLLIEKVANPNIKGIIRFQIPELDSTNYILFTYGSCLVVAAGENKIDILDYLISIGVDIDDKELSSKKSENSLDIDKEGWNALQWASVRGNLDVVKYLINKGANINSSSIVSGEFTNKELQTPLLLALKYNQIKIAIELINQGADVNQFYAFSKSPLALANQINNRELIDLLKTKKAKMFYKKEMQVKHPVKLEKDTVVQKYFTKEEIIGLNYFLSYTDSLIMGEKVKSRDIKEYYIDSLRKKIEYNYISSNINSLYGVNSIEAYKIIEKLKDRGLSFKLWSLKTNDTKTREYLQVSNQMHSFIKDCIYKNNNLYEYAAVCGIAGDYVMGGYTLELININPILDRDRLFVSFLLLNSIMPVYTPEFIIEKRNLDKSINYEYFRYKKALGF